MSARRKGSAVLILGMLVAVCTDDAPTPTQPPVSSAFATVPSPPPATAYGWVTGGGHLRDGPWDMSFAGQVRAEGTEWSYVAWADADRWVSYAPQGHWIVQFHSASNAALSGKTFRSTGFLDASFAQKRVPTSRCLSRYIFTVEGTLDGEPGWVAWIAMADAGHRAERGAPDSFRMALWAPGDHPGGPKVLDTFDAMTPNATCLGGKKRNLANGNLSIHLRF